MANQKQRTAGCLCGAVNLTVACDSGSIGVCHCSMCRKWGGGPLLAVEHEGDIQLQGEENVSRFASSDWAERAFCSQCGSHLFYRLKQGAHYAIPVGLFDGDNGWTLDQQIFIDEKPAYYAFANDTKNMTGEEVFAQFSPS